MVFDYGRAAIDTRPAPSLSDCRDQDWFHLEDDQLLREAFATGTDQVLATTFGLNWYLNTHLRVQFNYVASFYDDGVGRAGDDLHSFQLRMQLDF